MSAALDEVRGFLAPLLSLDPSAIGEDAAIGVTQNWDSLKHMEVSIQFETRFGISLDADSIVKIASVRGMVELLEARP